MTCSSPPLLETRQIIINGPPPVAKLRIALVCNENDPMEHWQKMAIDRISADPLLDFCGLVKVDEPSPAPRSGRIFAAFSALEFRVLARQPHYEPRLKMESGGLQVSPAAVCATLETLQADIVVNCTQKCLPHKSSKSSAYSEWWFNFSRERDSRADWFGFDVAIDKKPVVDLALMMRRHGKLHNIAAASFNAKPSGARNNASTKERAVTLLIRELRRAARTGVDDSEHVTLSDPGLPPATGRLFAYGASLAGVIAKRLKKSNPFSGGSETAIWTLFSGQGDIADFDISTALEIRPGMESIKADPFLFRHEDETYLFYEAYAETDDKAHIAVARFDGDTLVELGPVLERPYHLSYPLVFRDGDDIFMLPETHQAGQIEVWRCTEFPLKWELYSTAFEGQSAADSVLTRHDGKWWLFTNLSDHHAFEDHCSELHVFQVDGPKLKAIVPHRLNPVVMGSCARNGGRIICANGTLYRPAQRNEFGIYGYGLNIMEIGTLTLDDYSERCVRAVEPDFQPGIFGCHHFDADGGRYIVDARLRRNTQA